MFVSNLAAQAVHGEISLPKRWSEIRKWERQQQWGSSVTWTRRRSSSSCTSTILNSSR